MEMDCAIIGGGPAGLNAALVLGRARRNVILFDNNKPRNAVTQESHGFLTRDGISPSEFRAAAHGDIAKYPSVRIQSRTIDNVNKVGNRIFQLETSDGVIFQARKLLLATGLKETLPQVKGIYDYYGKSLFNCPYCDGWELRDKPLVVIGESQYALHMAKLLYNWSSDILICTNGSAGTDREQRKAFRAKGIPIIEQKIKALAGQNGVLAKIVFENGQEELRAGGFVSTHWMQASAIGQNLGCAVNEMGGIITDSLGRTNVENVYAAGDTSIIAPSQLIIAAAEGSRAAIGVNTDIAMADF